MSAEEEELGRVARSDLREREHRAIELLHSAGLLEWAEYQRVRIRYAHRWPTRSAGFLGPTPGHAPDCGCSECPPEPDPPEAA